MVGLQARASPVIRYLRNLLKQGYVGEVLSTILVGSGGILGPSTTTRDAYINDRANGANLLTIPFGHTIDALCHCLGEFSDLVALTAMRRQSFKVTDTGEQRPVNAEDQIVVGGKLQSGAVVSAHYRGGVSRATNLRWEINGTDGDLEITAPLGYLQLSPLTLRGGRGTDKHLVELLIPAEYRTVSDGLSGPAVNVAEVYAQFALGDRAPYPTADFDAAVQRHRLLEAIETAAAKTTSLLSRVKTDLRVKTPG